MGGTVAEEEPQNPHGLTPTAVFVKPQVGYQVGNPSVAGGFATATQDREAYYASTHLQTIQFEITRLVVATLNEKRVSVIFKKLVDSRILGNDEKRKS